MVVGPESNLWTVIYQTYSIDGFLPDNHPMICEITLMYCMVYWAILIWYIICIVQNACRTRVYVCLDFYLNLGFKKLTSKLPMLQYYTCAFSMIHINFSSQHFTTLYTSFPFLDFHFCDEVFFSVLKKVTGISWAVLNSFYSM